MPRRNGISYWLGLTRFLTLLALVMWVGGLAFLGPIAAPAVFKVNRPLGPIMVGAMLQRFTPITYVCGVLLLLGWLAEIKLPRPGRTGLLWWLQGACSVLMLLIALYLGQSLMPRIVALQPQAVAARSGESTWSTPQAKAEFDTAHKGYTDMTSIVAYLGLGALLAFSLRTTATTAVKAEADE
jgi:uncharacterized membrane protein